MQLSEKYQIVDDLNAQYRNYGATTILDVALKEGVLGRIAMVSSFGAESVALLHLVAVVNNHLPVLFVDTQMLFTETLVYQMELAEKLGLKDVRIIRASEEMIKQKDPDGQLHHTNPDACCHLRKTKVLNSALNGFDSWITGRKRYQGKTRQALQFFEYDAESNFFKVNPLAFWARDDVQTYIDENRLPRHPLVKQGYPSIGCAPCTSPVAKGEDPRAGRWRDQEKTECGIHFTPHGLVRTGAIQ